MHTQTPRSRVLFPHSQKAVGKLVFVVFLISVLATSVASLWPSQHAAAATTSTLNFQARLQSNTGALVPDGNYNVQFNLYNVSSGGSTLWTETYLVSNTQGVRVKNGYLTVNLGSLTSFPSTINWDQDLYLGLTVRGTGSCAFASCTPADSEMGPNRLKLTAVPYAFRAGQLAKYGGTYTSTLSLASPTVGDQSFVLPDMAAAGTFTILTTGSGVQLQTSSPGSPQTGHFNISGTGIAGSFQASAFDVAAAGVLSVGTGSTATGITIGNGSLGGTITVGQSTASNTISIGSANTLTGATQTITIGAGTPAGTGKATITIGNTNGASGVTLNAGTAGIGLNGDATVASGKSLTLTGGTGSFPGSPAEGQMYYRSDNKQLYIYENGKWQADRTTATKIVAASDSQNKEKADYVAAGSNADEVAINAAISALPSSGGTVYLLEGNYSVGATVSVPSNVTITGSGASTVIKIKASMAGNLNVFTNSDTTNGNNNITITNMKLDGNKANVTSGTHRGINFTKVGSGSGTSAVAGAVISNLAVTSFNDSGIRFSTSNNNKITTTTSTSNGNHGIELGTSDYNIVSNNTTAGNTARGISLTSSNFNAVTGNTSSGNTTNGIIASASTKNTITGNTVSGNTSSGITLFNGANQNVVSSNISSGNTTLGYSISTSSTGNSLSNNTADSNGSSGFQTDASSTQNILSGNVSKSNTSAGFNIQSDDNVISSNSALSNGTYGIRTQGASNNTISFNRVADSGQVTGSSDAINIDATSNTNNIMSNTITDTAGTGVAIKILSGATGNILNSNRYSGTGAASISDAGTSTVYVNQADASGNVINRGATSATSFMVQNAGGNQVLSVDTSGNQVVLGKAGGSGLDGKLVFNNATNSNTVTLATGTTSASYALTLPTALGSSGDCIKDTTGTGVLGFGTCGGGGGVTTVGAFVNGTSYANGASISGSTITFGAADATNPGLVSTGAQTFAGAKTFTGAMLLQNGTDSTTALQVKKSSGAGGASVLDVDTTNGRVGVGTAAPSEALTVNGNFSVRDADTPTKQYRFRTNGGALDFEAAGAQLFLSNWQNADYTGTQRTYLVLESAASIAQAIGSWQFRTASNGTTRHTIDGTAGADVAFNQNGEATNFSVQGDTDSSLFYAKGSTDRIGIGTNAPAAKLDVNGDVGIGSAANSSAGRIFGDSFESGNTKLWGVGPSISGSSSTSMETSIVRNGKYSLKMVNNNGTSTLSTIAGNTTTASVRAWVYVGSHTTGADDLVSLGAGSNTFTMYRDFGTGKLAFWNSVTSLGLVGSTVMSTGAWHQIELVVTVNATTGSATMYMDGASVYSQTNTNTGSTAIGAMQVGDGNLGRAHTTYFDDIAFDTVRPGDSANLNINDSLHVAGTSTFGGAALFQAGGNTATAFQVQNSSGTNQFTIDTATSNIALGDGTGSFALNTSNIDISTAGAITGATGITMASGNFLQNGSGTFGTGTGAVSLNGDTTVATGKNFSLAAGTGIYSQSYNNAGAGTAMTVTSSNTSSTQTNGILVDRNGASGTLTNGINITQTAGTLTNGLAFTGTIGTDVQRSSGELTINGGGGVSIQSGGSFTIAIGNLTDATVAMGSTTGTSPITIGQSTASNTISIGNANTANGNTQTINIGAGTPAGTGKATITIGNTANASGVTLNAGTSGISLNGNTTIAANKNFSMSSGTGTFAQTYAAGSGTAATINANATAANTVTNGLNVAAGGAGTVTNGINISQSAGTLTNGLAFSGTMTNYISSTNLTVSSGGAVTAAGAVRSNSGFNISGTAGASSSCSGSQALLGQVTSGGIVTGGSCGTVATSLQTAYNGSGTTAPLIQLAGTTGFSMRDAGTSVGNIFNIQNSAGTATYFNITSSGMTIQSSGGVNALIFDTATGGVAHLKILNLANTAQYNDIWYDTTNNEAVYGASSGNNVRVGNGSGNIVVALSNSADVFQASKALTLGAAYSSNDFTFQRNIVAGANSLTGAVVNIESLSTGTGTLASTILNINENNTSATGNLIVATRGGAGNNKFAVSGAGTVTVAAGQSYTGAGAVTLASGAGTALTVTGNAASTFSTTAGGLTLTSAAAATWGTTSGDLTLSAGGASKIVAKPGTDSTTSFQLQKSGGTVLLNANASNTRIEIGSTTTDTTAVLLTLDSYSTAADPTGVNGAMYYNTGTAQFRCYRDGAWEPCATKPIDRSFIMEEEFINGGTSAATTSTSTPMIGNLNWSSVTMGTACQAYTYNNASPAPSGDRPGILKFLTSGTSTANAGCRLYLGTTTGGSMALAAGQVIKAAVAVGATTNTILRVGNDTATTTNAQVTNSGVWWEADPTTGFWRYCYATGAAATCASSGVALAANTFVRVEIRITATGAGTSAATFLINGTAFNVSSVTINTSTLVRPNIMCSTAAAAAASQACYADYYMIRGDASAAR